MRSTGPDSEQERLLEEASAVVKEQSWLMKQAITNNNMRETLKHASNMICELRTGTLEPKTYYELYMQVFTELQTLALYFQDTQRHGMKLSALYESVQHAGNIIPRLYLLITVGAGFIQSKEAPAKEILTDLTELCKGVQHPIRGLFLRYYLSQCCKDKLPDTGSPYEGIEGGNVYDAIDFILNNFTEANRLWIRLNHQGSARDRARRERERHDLRVLVGNNLIRLSQLDGMDKNIYVSVVLPKLLDQVVSCQDTMAQQYLLDCIIQVFPDEYHLATLDSLLTTCSKTNSAVDLKPIIVNLMNRLAVYVSSNPGSVPQDLDVFELFRSHLDRMLDRSENDAAVTTDRRGSKGHNNSLASLIDIMGAYLGFTITLYPDRLDHLQSIHAALARMLDRQLSGGAVKIRPDEKACFSMVDLLSKPIEELGLSCMDCLSDAYNNVYRYLTLQTQAHCGVGMVNALLMCEHPEKQVIDNVSRLQSFMTLLRPLISEDYATDATEAATDQCNLAKICHLIRESDANTDLELQLLSVMRQHLGHGSPAKLTVTLVPVIYRAVKLAPKVRTLELQHTRLFNSTKKAFQFVYKTLDAYGSHCLLGGGPTAAMQTLKMWLDAAAVAGYVETNLYGEGAFESIGYEFINRALATYEDDITDSQSACIPLMVGALLGPAGQALTPDDYEATSTTITQYAAKLVRKSDQCRQILCCADMFWNPVLPRDRWDSRRVLECLQRCLRIAERILESGLGSDSSTEDLDKIDVSEVTGVSLFVDVLDRYVFYFNKNNEQILSSHINSLIALCMEHVKFAMESTNPNTAASNAKNPLLENHSTMHTTSSASSSAGIVAVKAHLAATIAYIRQLKDDPDYREKYRSIDLSCAPSPAKVASA
ncbi:Vacuolar protein sorting-associated protein 35 [Perkinsus chesapeaki]|uniref:Vacuolar protein sorting-associated protein 35 n=1 Tax=Perkinsus chesapeaki TaxID=330153 RepID=A0A7J6MPJ1_PERCH|nr:Vacuolar protein sorting-associated protein 35 [Perkinsus chesapeaki]